VKQKSNGRKEAGIKYSFLKQGEAYRQITLEQFRVSSITCCRHDRTRDNTRYLRALKRWRRTFL